METSYRTLKHTVANLLPRHPFARKVSVLAFGTASAQFLIVIASPVLTRLYTPDAFGLLAVFAGLLGVLAAFSTLRYHIAILLPREDAEAANIAILSLAIVLIVATASSALFFFRGGVSAFFNTPDLGRYLWLIPTGLLLLGSYEILSHLAMRAGKFSTIARTKPLQSVSMVGIQIVGAPFGPIALLLGYALGHAAGAAVLATRAIRDRAAAFRQVRFGEMIRLAGTYRRFPLFSTWGGAFNTAGREMPMLLLAALFSASAAGIYLLAHRVLGLPLTLIGKAVADVFFPEAVLAHRTGTLTDLVATVHGRLAQFAMPPAVVLVISGPQLFAAVFGESWRMAGEFAQLMAPWIYLAFVTSPLTHLFSVMGREDHSMVLQAVLLGSRAGGLVVGAHYGHLILAVALFSLGSCLSFLGFLVWVVKASGNSLDSIWRVNLRAITWTALLIWPLAISALFGWPMLYQIGAFALTLLLILLRFLHLLRGMWVAQDAKTLPR